jgi:hypothetical protein
MLVAAIVAVVAAAAPTGAAPLSPKLRSDLAGLVSGQSQLDPRIPPLVSGYVSGEIPYFVALTQPNDAAHATQITALGGRVLRAYGSFNAFEVASSPAVVQSVAALPHPFSAPGITDVAANMSRGPSTQAAPQVLTLTSPPAGTYYLVVDRARVGGTTTGDFGSFVLSLDEVR